MEDSALHDPTSWLLHPTEECDLDAKGDARSLLALHATATGWHDVKDVVRRWRWPVDLLQDVHSGAGRPS